MVIMGIDLGKIRTGIALCDKNNILSYPFCLIEESDLNIISEKVKKISEDNNVRKIIIGNPKNMNGSIGESAKNVYNFKKILSNYVNIEIILWDERLTTVSAQRNFASMNIKSRKYKKRIDKASASIILQNYIDFYKNQK